MRDWMRFSNKATTRVGTKLLNLHAKPKGCFQWDEKFVSYGWRGKGPRLAFPPTISTIASTAPHFQPHN